jgi:hypothetical protein
MIPTELKYGIYVFDLRNHEVYKDDTLSDLFETDFICARAMECDDNCALLFFRNTNQVIKLNLITKHIEYIKSFDKNIKTYYVCYGNSSYWILPMNSTNIYEWEMEKDIVSVHENKCFTDVISEGPLYSNLVFLENETLVLSCRLKKIMRIDRVTGEIDNPLDYPEGFKLVNDKFEWWPVFSQYIISGNKVLLFPCRGNMLLVYDIETGTMYGKEMVVTKNEVPYLNREMSEIVISKDITYERDKRTSLEDFITYICIE